MQYTVLNKPCKRLYFPKTENPEEMQEVMKLNDYFPNFSHQIRSIFLLEAEIEDLFLTVEPSTLNMKTYGLKIFSLFIRTCIEFESVCKQIIVNNKYKKKPNYLKIEDYKLLSKIYPLSKYKLKLVQNDEIEFSPFDDWDLDKSLSWYQTYGKVKHNSFEQLPNATLENLLNAIAAVRIIIYMQTWWEQNIFLPGGTLKDFIEGYPFNFGTRKSIFNISQYPQESDFRYRYDFNWEELKEDSIIFEPFDFDSVKA
ncbi:MAG TPA: hypothetical protein GXZ35_01770 [Acholeplasmataceae bacterium]|nr:hypothetical protein [Acholeplasmataceae bacterium]